MSNVYDIAVIGMGVAGTFACLKLNKENKNAKVIAFDIGRPPAKRRRQLEGYLGCLPNSDGKLYLNDLTNVEDLVGLKKIKSSYNYFNNIIENLGSFKTIKDKGPSVSTEKKIKKNGFDLLLNDYIQLYPKDIHGLSKLTSDILSKNKNFTFSFDNEIKSISKQKNTFVVSTEDQEFKCKKVILAVGRSGWRWAREVYSNFGIIDNNDIAKFGIRVEMNASNLKDFGKSNCTLIKNDKSVEVGPLCWHGTVIPEDHLDVAISAFRSNENRWKSDKVSFSIIGNILFDNQGFEQTDRISKLTFILSNDRIIKEKTSYILTDKSKISIIPEYEWLKDILLNLEPIIPDITSKAYFHVPTIIPMPPKINLGNNLESEIDGMFVVGESAGIHGILAAACTGIIAATEACK